MSQTRLAPTVREVLPPPQVPSFGPPPLTWKLIEEVLSELSGTPERVQWEIAALRSETASLSTALFLRRFFALGWSLIEEAPEPELPEDDGEGGMT